MPCFCQTSPADLLKILEYFSGGKFCATCPSRCGKNGVNLTKSGVFKNIYLYRGGVKFYLLSLQY